MKKTVCCISLLLTLTACNNHITKPPHIFPKPGEVVAKAEQPITNDPLTHFIFSVRVIADSSVDSGIYDIAADYGPNDALTKMTLPKGCEEAQPVIRKGLEPYSYIIGFKLKNDTTFYDYFEVKSTRTETKMRYIKAYSY